MTEDFVAHLESVQKRARPSHTPHTSRSRYPSWMPMMMSLPVHNGGQLSPLGKRVQGSTLAQQDCQTLTQNDSCPTQIITHSPTRRGTLISSFPWTLRLCVGSQIASRFLTTTVSLCMVITRHLSPTNCSPNSRCCVTGTIGSTALCR